jgi:Ca2+-binding EF-hand superfamily protein
MNNNYNSLNEGDIISKKEKNVIIESNINQDKINNKKGNYEELSNERSIISNSGDQSVNSRRPFNEDYNNPLNNRNPIDDSKNIFPVDIIKIAEECFKMYIKKQRKVNSSTIDNYEIKNLLEVIGIKKNEFEINNAINKVRMEKPKTFENDENGYTLTNFMDVVRVLKDYRIEDKLLVKVFKTIDDESDGLIQLENLEEISKKLNLDLSREEINDMLGYFDIENIVKNGPDYKPPNNYEMDFEEFSRLYYQG